MNREYRQFWSQTYENFGKENLRTYMEILDPVTYDPFGSYLLPGQDAYRSEWWLDHRGSAPKENWWVKGKPGYDVFQNLMVANDGIGSWSSRITVGKRIRTLFTPSTLWITNMDGMRFDASNRKNNFTFIASPGSNSRYGIHWESVLGDTMVLGATFAVHQRGTQPYYIPYSTRDFLRIVYVIITDERPGDPYKGAQVKDCHILADGHLRIEPHKIKMLKEVNYLRRKPDAIGIEEYWMGGQSFIPTSSLSGYWLTSRMSFDRLFEKDRTKIGGVGLYETDAKKGDGTYIEQDPNYRYAEEVSPTHVGYYEAFDNNALIYEFVMPENFLQSNKIQIKVLVGGDYAIDSYLIFARKGADFGTDGDWESKWNFTRERFNIRSAQGYPTDGSNFKWVTETYDQATGLAVLGVNMRLNYMGFKVNAEFVENYNYYKYPYPTFYSGTGGRYERSGSHRREIARAYYITMLKSLDKKEHWNLGLEFFRYPLEFQAGHVGGTHGGFRLVDDNDDLDDGSHEFPGLDIDRDLEIDTQGQAYMEGAYYYDPGDFVYGDDFDLNGVVDSRQNDSAPDYPYYTDRQGSHTLLQYKPSEYSIWTIGYTDVWRLYYKGKTIVKYGKMEHWWHLKHFGPVSLHSNLKYYPTMRGSYHTVMYLQTHFNRVPGLNVYNFFRWNADIMRKKEYDKLYDRYKIDPILSQWLGDFKQYLDSWAWVGKADYGFTFWKIDMRFFYKYYRKWYSGSKFLGGKNDHWTNIYPIFRTDIEIAPKTQLRMGIQGFRWLPTKYRRETDRLGDYDSFGYLIAIQNRSMFSGYNMLVTAGIRKDRKIWVHDPAKLKEGGYTTAYVSIRVE